MHRKEYYFIIYNTKSNKNAILRITTPPLHSIHGLSLISQVKQHYWGFVWCLCYWVWVRRWWDHGGRKRERFFGRGRVYQWGKCCGISREYCSSWSVLAESKLKQWGHNHKFWKKKYWRNSIDQWKFARVIRGKRAKLIVFIEINQNEAHQEVAKKSKEESLALNNNLFWRPAIYRLRRAFNSPKRVGFDLKPSKSRVISFYNH